MAGIDWMAGIGIDWMARIEWLKAVQCNGPIASIRAGMGIWKATDHSISIGWLGLCALMWLNA